ncbi:hypothetical protein ABIA18_002414 [Sinorhizobium fredii]
MTKRTSRDDNNYAERERPTDNLSYWTKTRKQLGSRRTPHNCKLHIIAKVHWLCRHHDPGLTERSCRGRQCTRNGHDPGHRCAFLQADRDRTDDDLGARNFLNRRRGHSRLDNHRREFNRILRRGQNQLALPRHRRQDDRWFGFSPYRSATSFTVTSGRRLSDTIPRLDLIRPVAMPLTPGLAARENLQVSMEKLPSIIHGKPITDHARQCNVGAKHRLQNNLRGRASIWPSQSRRAAHFVNSDKI